MSDTTVTSSNWFGSVDSDLYKFIPIKKASVIIILHFKPLENTISMICIRWYNNADNNRFLYYYYVIMTSVLMCGVMLFDNTTNDSTDVYITVIWYMSFIKHWIKTKTLCFWHYKVIFVHKVII